MGRLPVLPQQPARRAPGIVASRPRLPTVVGVERDTVSYRIEGSYPLSRTETDRAADADAATRAGTGPGAGKGG